MTNAEALILSFMKERGLTIEQMANDIGIATNCIQRMQEGRELSFGTHRTIINWLRAEQSVVYARPVSHEKAEKPSQPPIIHPAAPPTAKPPLGGHAGVDHWGGDDGQGSYQDVASRAHEEQV